MSTSLCLLLLLGPHFVPRSAPRPVPRSAPVRPVAHPPTHRATPTPVAGRQPANEGVSDGVVWGAAVVVTGIGAVAWLATRRGRSDDAPLRPLMPASWAVGDAYTCHDCGRSFRADWTEAEARTEAVRVWGRRLFEGTTDLVCDDCFAKRTG